MIEPFRVQISAATLGDLQARLSAARWPRGVTDSGGMPMREMREITRYWTTEFDWRSREREMNRLPHFRIDCGTVRLHCIHARCATADAVPLLLLHGWPGSFVEMLRIIPMLTESCHVVVPSLPGYGFSDAPSMPGMSSASIATLCATLMTALGYERFAVQGGDLGAGVATWLARAFPSRVLGMHLNYIPGSFAPFIEGPLTEEERNFLESRTQWSDEHGGYSHAQRTRPLTLSYALSDSPLGLAAWIVEKFREWADPRSPIPFDDILTNVTVYWATNTIGSSVRLYLESARTPLRFARGERVEVPCGIARFPYEAPFPPRSWIERSFNVVHWTDMSYGGHFAALEAPDRLARDVTAFLACV